MLNHRIRNDMQNYLTFRATLNNFSRFVENRLREDRCIQVAGSLTFTTLLSIIPILTIALTLISAFPVFSGFNDQIKHFILANLVPDSSSRLISMYLQQFSTNAAKLTTFGILFLALTAFALMLTIDHTFNTIWRVTKKRPLLHRILIYWGILTIGPILIGASLTLTSWLMSRSQEIVHTVPVVLKLAPMSLTFIALIFLYLIVPNRKVKTAHAILGGMVAGIVFELMKLGFGWYIAHFSTYALIYGAFSSLPIFLLWIFLSWLVVLSGAVLTSSLPYWRHDPSLQHDFPGSSFHNTLMILQAFHRCRKKGISPDIATLQGETRLEFDRIEEIVQFLNTIGWIKETVDGCWVLARDPDDILLRELYRLSVFDPGHKMLDYLPKNAVDALEPSIDISLAALFAEMEQ